MPSPDPAADRTALLGLLGCLPALLLVEAGLALALTGSPVAGRLTAFPPTLVLGGLAMALAVNLATVLRFVVDRSAEAWSVGVVVRRRVPNLAVGALALALIGALALYALGEAFAVVLR